MSSPREAVGVFESADDLQEAIDELLSNGFNRAELSLLASEDAVTRELGHTYKKASELEDDPAAPRAAYVSTEAIGDAEGALIGTPLYIAALLATAVVVVSGGTLAAAIAGATVAGGTGAAIGAILAQLVGKQHAQRIEEQLVHGGLLLWVRTWNTDNERSACDILKKHSGQDVHVHILGE
ncbi:hypothetical protein GRI43_01355 [Altererythrobacter luteolus]|uniref:Heat induced stress protein YflT n=1 Tax=Pontixanthobacter luteolus TaxID=295089 RepID=A0A6I4UVZ2_9SPHN|nr:hypothetical protein [Pontixanthobacter luteolus]MXP46037.1 hypothetical protein [Pontixanthobacter luteolus]